MHQHDKDLQGDDSVFDRQVQQLARELEEHPEKYQSSTTDLIPVLPENKDYISSNDIF